jgi:hypothetical protein
MNINAVKTVIASSNQSSAFTQLATGDSGKFADAHLDSAFTESVTATKTLGPITANVSSQTDISADADVITGNIINVSSQGFVVAAFGRIRPYASIEDTSFALNVTAVADKVGQANLQTTTAVNASVTKTFGAFSINCASTTNVVVSATIKTGSIVVIESNANQQATARVTKSLSANVNSAMAFNVTARETSEIAADLFTQTIQATTAIKTARAQANITASSSLSATPKITRTGISLEFSFADTFVDADVIRNLSSNVQANSNLTANAIRIVSGGANLTSNGFVLAIGREFRLEDSAIWVVRPETTTYRIQPEVREWRVSLEVREYTIKE